MNMSCQMYLPTTSLPIVLAPVYQTSFAHSRLGKPAAHQDKISFACACCPQHVVHWHAGACCRQQVHRSWQHSQSCVQAHWASTHNPGILSCKEFCACAPGPMIRARAPQRAFPRCAAIQVLLADLRLMFMAHLAASSYGKPLLLTHAPA